MDVDRERRIQDYAADAAGPWPHYLCLNYNLIWFGILLVKRLKVSMITSPVGLNVFIPKVAIGGSVKLEDLFRGTGPFLLMDAVTLAIMISLLNWACGFPTLCISNPGTP